MADLFDEVVLRETEVAALAAVRSGADTKKEVALHAGLSLTEARSALVGLASKGLVTGPDDRSSSHAAWPLTDAGKAAKPIVGGRYARRREIVIKPGSSSERFLEALDRPRRAADLVGALGVTKERVNQLIFRLLAAGKIKVADPRRPTRWVARLDDPTPLVTTEAEAVLSAFAPGVPTTSGKLAAVARLRLDAAAAALDELEESGLALASSNELGTTYLLTDLAQSHPQRQTLAKTADRAPLPVYSKRVRTVLTLLAEAGPLRAVEIGSQAGIEKSSINSLIQYLKRRGLATKAGEHLHAPHQITSKGRSVLDAWPSD